jgi:hypothetical protein
MNTNVAIPASKEVKVPNGNNHNEELGNKLCEIANMIRITHQSTGINVSDHWWTCNNLIDHDESIEC